MVARIGIVLREVLPHPDKQAMQRLSHVGHYAMPVLVVLMLFGGTFLLQRRRLA